MRTAGVLLGLAALVAANPTPQLLDLASVAALGPPPQPTIAIGLKSVVLDFDPTSAAKVVAAEVTAHPIETSDGSSSGSGGGSAKRARALAFDVLLDRRQAACATLAPGYGPSVVPDTAPAFQSHAGMAASASAAAVPTGYVQTYANLQASNNANGYLGYTTMRTYDAQACASMCDVMNGCAAVNIYFERQPTVMPGSGCDNPSSTTQIKCVFWGGPVSVANAVNTGQYMDGFHVVMAGGNGYVNRTVDDCPGYDAPSYLGDAAIDAPTGACAQSSADGVARGSYMGYVLFNDGSPFDTGKCAAACTAQSAYNVAHPPASGAPAQTCQFFNTYVLDRNGVAQGQYCALYSAAWDGSYATNTGQYDAQGNHYTISYSYSFANTSNHGVCTTG